MIVGSIVPPGTPAGHFETASVLTIQGIMKKYNLSLDDYTKMENKLLGMKLLDILFNYPDGPRYDTALYLIATTR